MKHFFLIGLIVVSSATSSLALGSISPSTVRSDCLAFRNVVSEEWYVQSADKKVFLFIHEIGKGEPAIVLHGGPGAGHRYLVDIAKGLEKDFRFVFYDQRGAGFTYSAVEDISMEKNVEDLETIRAALGVQKINLISHSAGTMLAMNYLKRYPEKVKNMVLLGALDPKNGKGEYFTPELLDLYKKAGSERNWFLRERPEILEEIEKAGLNKPVLTPKENYDIRRIRSAAGNIYNLKNWRSALFFVVNSQAARATQESTNFLYDWSGMLAKHPYPITVVNGEYDYIVGPKGSPMWRTVTEFEAKNVKLVIIQKAGHSSWIDEPFIFKNALCDGLKGDKR